MEIAQFLDCMHLALQAWKTMAPLRYAAKFDPFLSLDCAPMTSNLTWSKPRNGRDHILPSGNTEHYSLTGLSWAPRTPRPRMGWAWCAPARGSPPGGWPTPQTSWRTLSSSSSRSSMSSKRGEEIHIVTCGEASSLQGDHSCCTQPPVDTKTVMSTWGWEQRK